MRLFLSIIVSLSFYSCKKTSSSLKDDDQITIEPSPCDNIFDAQKYGDCVSVYDALISSETADMYTELGSEPYDNAFGLPMTLSIKGNCLARKGKEVVTAPCVDFNADYKWHFAKIDVSYKWNGVEQYDHAFHIITRESIKRWVQTDHKTKPSPTLECLDYREIEDTRQIKRYQVRKLTIVPCASSNLLFVTVPNDVVGDDNLYKERWSRIIALDTKVEKFANVKKTLAHHRPYLYKQCVEGCTNPTYFKDGEAGEAQKARLNLGEIRWTEGSWALAKAIFDIESQKEVNAQLQLINAAYMNVGNHSQAFGQSPFDNFDEFMLLGGCAPHRYNLEEHCFDGTAPFAIYKKLYDATVESGRGYVVQLRTPSGACVLWDGREVDCAGTKGIDKPDGKDASQFRLAFVPNPLKNAEPFVQFQRVNQTKDTGMMCYNIEAKAEVACCSEPGTCGTKPNYMMAAGDVQVPNGTGFKPYKLHFCISGANTSQNIVQECVDYIDPKWKKFQKIADIIGFIPILGSIPSYVLEGMICTSGEATISKQACLSVTIGVAIDLALAPLDMWGMIGTGSEVLEQLIKQGAVKPTAGIVLDFVTDPVLSTFAYMTAKRAFRQIEKTVGKEGLAAAAKDLTGPLTTAIVNRAIKNGIKGANVSGAYTTRGIANIIRGAANTATGVI